MTARATFRQSDITRAIKAAQAAGERVVIEIATDGTLRLIPVDDTPASADKPEEW